MLLLQITMRRGSQVKRRPGTNEQITIQINSNLQAGGALSMIESKMGASRAS